MEPITLDSSLLLNAKQIAASRTSVARVKKRLHDTELQLMLEPPKNELAEREEWRLKVTELIERKEKLPFPSLKEIEDQKDEEDRKLLQTRQEENKRRKQKVKLSDEEKLEQVKRIELKRRIDPNCKFFGPSEEGVPLRTVDNYSGCNSIYEGSRTLVRRNPKVEVLSSLSSSLPPWFGPGYYRNVDPALFSQLKETSYQVWVKSESRSHDATANELRQKKQERSVMRNPNARSDPPFCTDRYSLKNEESFQPNSSVTSPGSVRLSADCLDSLDQFSSISKHNRSLVSKNTSKGTKKSSFGAFDDETKSIMAATMPTIALNSLVAKIERHTEKHYKVRDYSLGALSLTEMPSADDYTQDQEKTRRRRKTAYNTKTAATETENTTNSLNNNQSATEGAEKDNNNTDNGLDSKATLIGMKSTNGFSNNDTSGKDAGMARRKSSALGLTGAQKHASKDFHSAGLGLAAEFLRKQRTSIQTTASDRRGSSLVSMGEQDRINNRLNALSSPSGSGAVSSSANDKTTAKLGSSINTQTQQQPNSEESQPTNITNGIPSPAVVLNNRPKLTIDPLAMDEDKYSFSSANRADPDFRVIMPKSPWLKSRAAKGFPKESQNTFKPYVSPIKNSLKKKALQSTADLLHGGSPKHRVPHGGINVYDGIGGGDYLDPLDISDHSKESDDEPTVPFELPPIEDDIRPMVRKWKEENHVYSPSTPMSLFKPSSHAVFSDTGSVGSHSQEDSLPDAPKGVELKGTPAQAHTWSSVVKAIPKFIESPTGRSTRALQGINGLLLEELAAAHLRSKLTNNSPEEFQKLISTDTSTKKSSTKAIKYDTSEFLPEIKSIEFDEQFEDDMF